MLKTACFAGILFLEGVMKRLFALVIFAAMFAGCRGASINTASPSPTQAALDLKNGIQIVVGTASDGGYVQFNGNLSSILPQDQQTDAGRGPNVDLYAFSNGRWHQYVVSANNSSPNANADTTIVRGIDFGGSGTLEFYVLIEPRTSNGGFGTRIEATFPLANDSSRFLLTPSNLQIATRDGHTVITGPVPAR